RVDPDGTTHAHALPSVAHLPRWAGGGGRLCMLPAGAAVDLLMLQAAARPRRWHLYHPLPPIPDPPALPVVPSPAPGVSTAPALSVPSSAVPMAIDAQVSAHRTGGAAGPPPTGPDRPLRLRLFGPVRLSHIRDPDTPLRLGRFTAVQVLLYLAVHRHGATSTEVAAALWPGVRPYPVDRVYRAASALRSAVHHATGVHILTRVGDRYRLDPDRVQVDLWQLTAAADQAATAADPHTGTGALHTIIDTYTGDLAAGQPGAWLVPHREAARRHALDAYTTLAGLSDPPTAAALLDRAVQVDPYNE